MDFWELAINKEMQKMEKLSKKEIN